MALSFYEKFDHTADLGIRITGERLSDLFVHAGLALFDLIAAVKQPSECVWTPLAVSGEDEIDLLINWLRELLYLFNGEDLVVCAIVVESIRGSALKARIGAVPFDPAKIRIKHEIKAVTYHQAGIEKSEKGYVATVIFDL